MRAFSNQGFMDLVVELMLFLPIILPQSEENKKNSVTKSQVKGAQVWWEVFIVRANGGGGWAGGRDVVARSGPALPAGPAQRAARLCGRA